MKRSSENIIRSTKISIKYANCSKKKDIHRFIDEYKRVMVNFIDILWSLDNPPVFVSKLITSQIDTFLPARLIQCAGKQASGIVRGAKKKQQKRLFQIKKFMQEGNPAKASKIQAKYDQAKVSKPTLDDIKMELDSRFITINLDNPTSFDGWISIGFGDRKQIKIPFKKTKHFNKLSAKGKIKNGIRLSKSEVSFMFDIPKPKSDSDNVAGVDIGVKSLLSIDYGDFKQQSDKNIHGHNFDTISERIARRKKGSKGFSRTVEHRKNYINAELNKVKWGSIGRIRIEKIRNLRFGKNTSRKLKHFVYDYIFERLQMKSQEHGVLVSEISPTYTSQRCSLCGWTRKSNRKGQAFKCGQCGFTADADLNAASNIRLDLPELNREERLLQKNRNGFYWNVVSEEPIVPHV